MFDQTPHPSSVHRHKFQGINQLPHVSTDSFNQQSLADLNWNKQLSVCQSDPSALFMPMANKEDNPTYSEAMHYPDSAGFIAAMEAKIASQAIRRAIHPF